MNYYDKFIEIFKGNPIISILLIVLAALIAIIPLIEHVQDRYLNREVVTFEDNELTEYANMRFGFIIKHPLHWDNKYPPTNSDGIVSISSDNPDVEIRSYASHYLKSLDYDFEEYIEWTIESLVSEKNAKIETDVESTIQLIIPSDYDYSVVSTILGKKIEYTYNENRRKLKTVRYFYMYEGVVFEVLCTAPKNDYESYKEFFYDIGKTFKVIEGIDR